VGAACPHSSLPHAVTPDNSERLNLSTDQKPGPQKSGAYKLIAHNNFVSTTKYVYDKLPRLNPTFFHAWLHSTNEAGATVSTSQKTRTNPPASQLPTSKKSSKGYQSLVKSFVFDAIIDAHVCTLLTKAIPDKHRTIIEDCKTATNIWLRDGRRASQIRDSSRLACLGQTSWGVPTRHEQRDESSRGSFWLVTRRV
jgi:hypothetical protein